MDPTQQKTPAEIDIDQAVATLMEGMPPVVQDFLSGPQRNEAVMSLSQKYQLHADQAGEFERSLIFMLLGIATPEEFVSALQKAGVSSNAIDGLVNDVNEQIFVRLRKQEEALMPTVTKKDSPQVPTVPPMEIKMQAPVASVPPAHPAPIAPPLVSKVAAQVRQEQGPTAQPIIPPSMDAGVTPLQRQGVNPANTRTVSPQSQVPPTPTPQISPERQALQNVLKGYGIDPYRETPE